MGYAYDNDFRVSAVSVNGSSGGYQYDADSLLTAAGALTIGRQPSTGRVSGSTLGVVTTTQGYHPDYGEPNGYTASVSGTAVYGYTLYRDLSGRIFQKVETVQVKSRSVCSLDSR